MTVRENNHTLAIKQGKQPVMVRWLDSYGPTGRWQEIGDIHPERLVAVSVGWIVARNRESIVVVPHLIDGNDRVAKQGCGEMTIPKKAILAVCPLSPTS